ncbi:MAG: tetratricopeptide repeat protein [Caulobacterales bacterium]|nr:tetratricopeptide repeat protein [Caulobacterales bacterium]
MTTPPPPDELESWLPQGGARVLVVSRHDGWSRRFPTVILRLLETKQAWKLLRLVSGRDDESGLRSIAGAVQGSPLALTHVAAFLRANPGAPPAGYAQRFAQITELTSGDVETRTAATTLALSLAHVAEREPTTTAILRLAALFAPDDIPYGLLTAAAAYVPRAVFAHRTGAATALRALHRYALIRLDVRGPEPMLSIHPEVQRAVRAEAAAHANDAVWAAAAVKGAAQEFASRADADPEGARALIPHMLALLAREPADAGGEDRAELERRLAEQLVAQGDYVTAEPIYRQLERQGEPSGPAGRRRLAARLAGQARLYAATGRVMEAERMARRVLMLAELETGASERSLDDSVDLLADILIDGGRRDAGEAMAKRSVELADAREAGHEVTVSRLRRLARAYVENDRFDAAEAPLRRVYEMCQAVHGPRHVTVAAALAALAQARLCGDHLTETPPLLERALDIWSWCRGPNHPGTRVGAHALVRLHLALGRDLDARVAAGRYGVAVDSTSTSDTNGSGAAPASAATPAPEGPRPPNGHA